MARFGIQPSRKALEFSWGSTLYVDGGSSADARTKLPAYSRRMIQQLDRNHRMTVRRRGSTEIRPSCRFSTRWSFRFSSSLEGAGKGVRILEFGFLCRCRLRHPHVYNRLNASPPVHHAQRCGNTSYTPSQRKHSRLQDSTCNTTKALAIIVLIARPEEICRQVPPIVNLS